MLNNNSIASPKESSKTTKKKNSKSSVITKNVNKGNDNILIEQELEIEENINSNKKIKDIARQKDSVNIEESEKKLNSVTNFKTKYDNQNDDVEMSACDEDEDPADSIHINAKDREKLSERIKCLANDGLASVVRLVQKECPACIEDLNEDKLIIKITHIDKKTYEQINQETNQENLGVKKNFKKAD